VAVAAGTEGYTEEELVERDEALAIANRLAEEKAWRSLLASEGGRLIVTRMLQQTGWLQQSYMPERPLDTAFREGQRSVGRALYDMIMRYGPNAWAEISAKALPPED
jgi:hypothetical protein